MKGLGWLFVGVSIGAIGIGMAIPAASDESKEIVFNRDVKPILSGKCFRCHGPDVNVVAAGLRLDSFEEATKDRDGSRAIVPGSLQKSLLVSRIEKHEMPPPNSDVKALTKEEVDILKRWIEGGAKYDAHWSFVAPQKPVPPKVSDAKWPNNDIDRFILAKLDAAKLRPEKEADKHTLISRVALTLTGLPPTPGEIETFIKDTKPGAYERMVDRYLASEAYGEHQARYWLDAVRYGDTHGLHLDNEREVYPYRDWVIRAFNEDVPFDQFTIWQLAGDMLPKPTLDQLVATGYIRMNPTTNEGGAIEEEFLAKNTFDRVDTTSTIFLGLTVACARCHDHKYDPISQREYYQMYAFFNSTADAPFDGNELLPAPFIPVPSPEERKTLDGYDSKISNLIKGVDLSAAEEWLSSSNVANLPLKDFEISGPYDAADYKVGFATAYAPEPGSGGGADWRPFPLEAGKQYDNIGGKANAATYVRGKIISPKAARVEVTIGSDDALKVWLNDKLIHQNEILRGVTQNPDNVVLDLKSGENTILLKVINSLGPDGLSFRFGGTFSTRIAALAKTWFDPKKLSERKPSELAELYLLAAPSSPASIEYQTLVEARAAFVAKLPKTLIAKELEKPRVARVLKRGEYSLPGEAVDRGIPKALGSIGGGVLNRLSLAKWLVSPKNPLVSRVFVNRIWQQHFGIGIVRTSEDFGAQGEWPSNLKLLDYLATYFMENGWSVKKLNRLIVTSAAFRQESVVTKTKLEHDPENRLISRGPRFRLDAEVIRDRALATSGLLVKRIGGKGFKPYQPEGLWEAIAFVESTTSKYVRDRTAEIYRRSLYLFWKRTSPHPIMLTFDAPMRESCTVRRSRTNTPVQALVTLNEPAFLESARAMAQRLISAANNDAARIDRLGIIAFGRPFTQPERNVLMGALKRYRERFAKSEDDAKNVLAVGDSARNDKIDVREHASWMLVCSTVMNTDEFLTQH